MFYVFDRDSGWLTACPTSVPREARKIREHSLPPALQSREKRRMKWKSARVPSLYPSYFDPIDRRYKRHPGQRTREGKTAGIGPTANCEKASRPHLVILSSSHCLAAEFKGPRREHKEVSRALPCFIREIFYAEWYPSSYERAALHNKI